MAEHNQRRRLDEVTRESYLMIPEILELRDDLSEKGYQIFIDQVKIGEKNCELVYSNPETHLQLYNDAYENTLRYLRK